MRKYSEARHEEQGGAVWIREHCAGIWTVAGGPGSPWAAGGVKADILRKALLAEMKRWHAARWERSVAAMKKHS